MNINQDMCLHIMVSVFCISPFHSYLPISKLRMMEKIVQPIFSTRISKIFKPHMGQKNNNQLFLKNYVPMVEAKAQIQKLKGKHCYFCNLCLLTEAVEHAPTHIINAMPMQPKLKQMLNMFLNQLVVNLFIQSMDQN